MSDPKFPSCSLEMLKRWALPLLTCIICIDPVCGITVPCDQTYPAQNGNLCYPCSPGYYKVSDCVVNGDQAGCRPCGSGEYQPDCDNATRCETCKRFCNDRRQVKVKNCTATTDMVCQCRAGFYWKPDESKPDEGHCKDHSKCKEGEGLIAVGTPYEDTKCAPCEKGETFSSNDSFENCVPCSVCNSTIAIPCTAEHDSVCGSLPEKSSPTMSSKDSGNSKVTVVVIPVALAAVIGAVVLGVCLYRRRRRNNEKSIANGIKQGQCVEITSSQMENGNSATSPSNDHDRDAKYHSRPRQELFRISTANNNESDSRRSLSTLTQNPEQIHDDSGQIARFVRETEISKAQGPQSNGHDIQNRNEDQHIKSHDTGDIGDGTEDVVSSQSRCTLNGTHKDNFRNTGNNRSTEELQESLNTHNNITDEDQKRVEDINQNSKDCTTSAMPEKNIRSNCTNKREEGLPNGLTANDTKLKSQEHDRHRSVLGDRTASPDSKENVPESNENIIYEGPNNGVNEVSKLNDIVHGDNNVDVSVDAAGVSARHGVKRESLSTFSAGENRSETEEAELITGTNDSSETEEAWVAEEGTQPEGSYGPTTVGTSVVRPTTGSSNEQVWQEVNSFLSCHLSWEQFKMFIRSLTAKTNNQLLQTIEADMENTLFEAQSKTQEAMYKLMIRWRQATPEATIQDVYRALESCRLKLVAERLKPKIDSVHVANKRVVIQNSDNGQNVVETLPRGELSASDSLQTVSNGILANGHCSNNLQMMELKV